MMREFFDRVCIEAHSLLEARPDLGQGLEYVLYGGESGTVRGFRARCDFVERLRAPVLARLLPVDRPGHKAMQAIGVEVYSSATLILQRSIDHG